MSHEPTNVEINEALMAFSPELDYRSDFDMRLALTAANSLRDRRIRNEALEEAAREIDCGCPERDAVLAAKTRVDRCYACSRSECCAELAAAIRALKDKEASR